MRPAHPRRGAPWPRRKGATVALGILAALLLLPSLTATGRPAAAAAPPPQEPSPTPTTAPSPTLTPLGLEPAFPNLTFERMVSLAYPGDGTHRLFVVLQAGQIRVFDNTPEVSSADLFLDIREQVSTRGNEEGLLGLAFDPGFARNGYFYVYYSAAAPRRSVLSRFSVSPTDPGRADPESELVLLQVEQPFANHNGGTLVFGPEGYLYVTLGDGGLAGDPFGNGQNPATLLGSILRIDVRDASPEEPYRIPPDNPFVGAGGGVREEVWAYGLRNPWKITFDREQGTLWAGDVGQNRFEEIDVIVKGGNYGWNTLEGAHCFPPGTQLCDQSGLIPPVFEYRTRVEGCSVTGGYVYRGSRLPRLAGAYVYGDFCSGKIWGLRYDGTAVTDHALLADSGLRIPSFGEDESGELYVLAFDGPIYRLVDPSGQPPTPTSSGTPWVLVAVGTVGGLLLAFLFYWQVLLRRSAGRA